jgi:peptidyl-prolyl cis-trans isomerase C
MRLAWIALVVTACGGGSEPAPAPATRAIGTVAPAASSGDLRVATVDGRPVWGSCVAAQIARGAAKTRQDALDQCIAFELMAQEAERRGLAADPSVGEATRTAMVNRVVETAFEATHQTPESLGAPMAKWLADNAWRMHRPELRSSTYARIVVPKDAPAEVDAKAKQLAEQIAAEVDGETGLFGVNLREIANRIAASSSLKLEVADAKPTPRTNLDPVYGDALFALPEVGRATRAVRTPWGWDVIVWTGGLPAKESTREELAAERFLDMRRQTFQAWVNQLIKQHGTRIELDQAQLQKLEGSS